MTVDLGQLLSSFSVSIESQRKEFYFFKRKECSASRLAKSPSFYWRKDVCILPKLETTLVKMTSEQDVII